MLNVKYWRILCDVIYLLAQVCIVSFDRAYKEVYTKPKILKIFYVSVFVRWLYLQKAMYRPCGLDRWHMKVFFVLIDNDPISGIYEFQIDISSNSREIKYQNMGIGFNFTC